MALRAAALVSTLAFAATASPRRDLDVALPPGFPLDWVRAVPMTGRRPADVLTKPREVPQEGTRVGPSVKQAEVPRTSGSDLLRIVTVDLVVEIPWVAEHEFGRRKFLQVKPGALYSIPPIPRTAYWAALAPLLRLQLHPSMVSRGETLAFLLEVGEAAIPALEAARSEQSLKADCELLLHQIGKPPDRDPSPLPTDNPWDAMVHRLLVNELTGAHPYALDGSFLPWSPALGADLLPYVLRYVQHSSPFLRRNAVSCLQRFSQKEATDALLRITLETDDAVSRVRALTAIARGRRSGCAPALADLLPRTRSDGERAAVLHALGCLGDEVAIPAITAYADQHQNSDIWMECLGALARIPTADAKKTLRAWLRGAEARITSEPTRWRVQRAGIQADIPDSARLRSQILLQLIRVATVRCSPGDAAAANALLACLQPGPEQAVQVARRGMYPNSPVATIHSAVQMLFLDALATCGEKGEAILTQVVDGDDVDPALRGAALRLLPDAQARAKAAALVRGNGHPGLRAFALELLDRAEDRAVTELAREALFTQWRAGAVPQDAQLQLFCDLALQMLGPKHRITWDELRDVFHAVADAPPAPLTTREATEKALGALMDDVAGATKLPDLRKPILELIKTARGPKGAAPQDQESMVRRVDALLRGWRDRAGDADYRELIFDSILDIFGFGQARTDPNELQFQAPVPLRERVLLESARMGGSQATATLARVLANPTHELRRHAALALGFTRDREAGKQLIGALDDGDPIVRFCAYLALKQLTGQDHRADWLFGDGESRRAARSEYTRWLLKQR